LLGRSRLEAFLAATILAGSWEFAYHSRWIAPDALMVQFALLSFLCLALGRARKTVRWFYIGAIAAGLAAGTKYPGALSLFFLIAGAAQTRWQQDRSLKVVLKQSVGLAATAFTTFVVTTPGVLIDPFAFFGHIRYLQSMYKGGHYGYTVTPGFPHLLKILEYYSLQFFSHYWAISIVFASLFLIGLVALLLERQPLTLLLVAFSAAYVGYFSQQAELDVRNVLVAAPLLCIGAARGIMVIRERLAPRLRLGLAAVVAMVLLVNFGWQVYAARQIKIRNHLDRFMAQFVEYVRRSPDDKVFISAKLAQSLRTLPGPIPDNLVTDPNAPHTKVAFFQTEGPDRLWENWTSNWWGMYETTFGPLEVNLEAYSTFVGNERIILMPAEHLKKLPLKIQDMVAR
jgi:4-amino-4-deoxy-L-arabinose transferase-like glycosyltransferase